MRLRGASCAIAVAVLAAVVLYPSRARAEVTAHEQIVSLDFGVAVPFTKLATNEEYWHPSLLQAKFAAAFPGFFIGGQYIYQLTPNIGVGADLNYSDYGNANRIVDGRTENTSSYKLNYEALGRYVFIPESKFNPYVILGVGLNSIHVNDTYGGVQGIDKTFTTLSASPGFGVETEIVKSVILGFETRWRYLGHYALPAAGMTYAWGPASEITAALRVGYKFGGK